MPSTERISLSAQPGQHEVLPGTEVNLVIPARLDLLAVMGKAVREYCAALPAIFASHQAGLLPPQVDPVSYSHFVYSAELLLQEVASNVVRHGYKEENPEQKLLVILKVSKLPGAEGRLALVMELRDTAVQFDPTALPWQEPDPLEPRESGYGMYLIRKLASEVSYRYASGCNCLQIVKYLEGFQ